MRMTGDRRGFTLIELVATIVVLSVLVWFTFKFLDFAVRTYVLVRSQSTLYTDGTYMMERIARELNDAYSITTPASGGTGNTLVFSRLHPSAATVTFTQSGRDVTRNGVLIARNVKTFSVKHNLTNPSEAWGALDGSVTVSIELDDPSDPTIPAFTLSTTIVPNNYSTGAYVERAFYGNYYENIK